MTTVRHHESVAQDPRPAGIIATPVSPYGDDYDAIQEGLGPSNSKFSARRSLNKLPDGDRQPKSKERSRDMRAARKAGREEIGKLATSTDGWFVHEIGPIPSVEVAEEHLRYCELTNDAGALHAEDFIVRRLRSETELLEWDLWATQVAFDEKRRLKAWHAADEPAHIQDAWDAQWRLSNNAALWGSWYTYRVQPDVEVADEANYYAWTLTWLPMRPVVDADAEFDALCGVQDALCARDGKDRDLRKTGKSARFCRNTWRRRRHERSVADRARTQKRRAARDLKLKQREATGSFEPLSPSPYANAEDRHWEESIQGSPAQRLAAKRRALEDARRKLRQVEARQNKRMAKHAA